MSLDDFYTDEPIDFGQSDSTDNADYQTETSGDMTYIDSVRHWDYFEPDDGVVPPWGAMANQTPADTAGQPKKIVELLEMIRHQPWQITREKNFYEQALFMADYTDSTNIVPFQCYFPVYNDMNVTQLRSYFTIRKMWRQGKFPDVSLSYLFVYVYELLMQVGLNHPEEGYEIMQELLVNYAPSYPNVSRYLNKWLRDYVVYYNLTEHFQELFTDEWNADSVAATLADYKTIDDDTLMKVLVTLSNYNPTDKTLFKKAPGRARFAFTEVLRAVLPMIERTTHHRLETFCLGQRSRRQVRMFNSAVFYNPRPVRQAEIQVSPRTRFFCQGGLWSRDVFISNKPLVRRILGSVLHETDRQLRETLGVRPTLKPKAEATPFAAVIHAAIVGWFQRERAAEEQRKERERVAEAQREMERRRVAIDFSKLSKIRSDAAVIMERLATNEEKCLETKETAESKESLAAIKPILPLETIGTIETSKTIKTSKTIEANKTIEASKTIEANKHGEPLTLSFLRLFLSGGDWRAFLRDRHIPEGVMVEKINDKAMDALGDIVLEDDGTGLMLIEDYRADVEQWLEENS